MKLKDKMVVITGSSSGIGLAAARLFAGEGAKLILNSAHNEHGGQAAEEELMKITQTYYKRANVGTRQGAAELLDYATEKFGKIDILINNAGTGRESDFKEVTDEEIQVLLQDNLLSTLYCSQHAITHLTQEDTLKIINTSSIRGWEWGGNGPVYAAAKAGVNSLTRTLARRYAPNVTVNAVAPGFTKTPNYDAFSSEVVDSFLAQSKLNRWIDVEEIADAILFLAKNDAITGEVIYVDAGFRLK